MSVEAFVGNRLNRFIDLQTLLGHVDFELTLSWLTELFTASIGSAMLQLFAKLFSYIAPNIKSMFTFFSVTMYDCLKKEFLVMA